MLDQLLDLDHLLLELVAPAYAPIGAPAQRVLQLLRALLLLNLKNIRSENFLVQSELKTNLLYRWFVRLEKDATLNDSFRIALVRLRQRLARALSEQQWHDFLAQTVGLAQRHFPPEPRAAAHTACQAAALPITASHKPSGPPQVGSVTFDLTPAKARARILDQRDNPERKIKLPRSHGDLDAYWITKRRRTAAGKIAETTLGYEVGFFSTQSGGLITGVCVREAAQANKTEFTNWSDQYRQDWQLGPGQLELSADAEFFTGEILRHFEQREQRLFAPPVEPQVAKGKLDARYFTYLAAADLFICHEGAELKRLGHDKQKQRTRYRAPAEACAHCPSASLCKGGAGPRKVSRSDFADEFARAREQTKTAAHAAARWAQHVYAEGSFAHSNCLHGLDHARYYGQPQMLLQSYWTAVALNLQKACRWSQTRVQATASARKLRVPN